MWSKFRAFPIIAALLASACIIQVPVPPNPEPPKPNTTGALYIKTVPVMPGLQFAIDGNAALCAPETDEGVAFCNPIEAGSRSVSITNLPEGLTAAPITVDITANINTDIEIDLVLPKPPAPAFKLAAVTVDGPRFVEDGKTWVYRGFTDFRLYDRYLRGEDISPLLKERAEVGANTLRVLGMSHCWEANSDGSCKVGVGLFHPQDHADYYDRLRPFADYVGTFGLRVEFVVFADAQVVMPDSGTEGTHLDRVVGSLSGAPNVFIEVANEPFKNIPGGADAATALMGRIRDRGLLVASGNYDFAVVGDHLELASGHYVTFHPERKPEWPRTSKDAYDLRDGFGGVAPNNWPGFHKPVISDEPMGAAEQNSGSRSAVPDDFAYFAAESALAGAGGTFHSDAGLKSELLGPIQKQSAIAFFTAQKWVPVDAQLWGYQRGDANGGPGIGNMPMEHTDALALRTFCKGNGGEEWCDVIRPADGWTAQARDGWHILDQSGPHGALVHLGR